MSELEFRTPDRPTLRRSAGTVGAMTKATTRVLAGVAVGALAAASVAAIVRYRQGQTPLPDDAAHLDELEARLREAEEPGMNGPPSQVGRVIQDLRRNQDVSVARLRRWIVGIKHGTLSPEQANMAESDFDALEREADQRGA